MHGDYYIFIMGNKSRGLDQKVSAALIDPKYDIGCLMYTYLELPTSLISSNQSMTQNPPKKKRIVPKPTEVRPKINWIDELAGSLRTNIRMTNKELDEAIDAAIGIELSKEYK